MVVRGGLRRDGAVRQEKIRAVEKLDERKIALALPSC